MVKLHKLSINICVGESGDRLTRASKILEELTGQKPSTGHAQQTIRSFGIHRNEEISVFCTVRGLLANDLLERALRIKEYRLSSKCFTDQGTFCFGIDEHIDLDGMKYDPNIGIFGMNFVVVCGKSGIDNPVTKEEAILWFQNTFQELLRIQRNKRKQNRELMLFRYRFIFINPIKKFNLNSTRNSSTVSIPIDPCTGCEIPCTKHASCPPEILQKIDQSDMTNSVEKYRRHLCIGQSISPSQWPKKINNLPGDYIKELTRIFEQRKEAIGYPIKLTAASIPSRTNSEQTADWYLFPDQLKLNNIHINHIEKIVEKLFLNDQSILQTKIIEEYNHLSEFDGEIQCERLNGLWILVCCHQQRDERCGIIGPILVDEIEKHVRKTNQIEHIHCLQISHIGGHRFAGNIIIYPSGTWYGRVLPCHIPLLIDAYTSSSEDLKAKLKPVLRGCLDTRS